jgi:hypothetical protein
MSTKLSFRQKKNHYDVTSTMYNECTKNNNRQNSTYFIKNLSWFRKIGSKTRPVLRRVDILVEHL